MPKVSVIIPNYNHARYLDQRIGSVLGQTYQDFELLLLDDASTDNSREVFAQCSGDPRVRVLLNEANSGSPFKQWNKGVREAAGEYVWIAESDDFADARLLETLVRTLDAHPTAGLAYCQSYLTDADGVVTGTCEDWTQHMDPDHWKQDFLVSGREECRRFHLNGTSIPNASAVLFRRSVYIEAGYADETMRACGDVILWSKLMLRSDVAFVAQPLNYFRKYDSSTSASAFSDGRLLREQYQQLEFMIRHVQPSSDEIDQTCEGLLSTWLYCRRSSKISLSRRQELRIFQAAMRVDKHLFWRVPRRMARSLQRRNQPLRPRPIS